MQLIDHLKQMGRVNAVLGGTMGRVAVIDADLEGIINHQHKKTSEISIRDMAEDSDIVIIPNQAKSRETGLVSRDDGGKACRIDKPLIQIDLRREVVADSHPGT